MATIRPVPDSSTDDAASSSPAAIDVTIVIPTGDADPGDRYNPALSPRLTSTLVRSASSSTVPLARSCLAAQTAVVCALAPMTLAPSTTAAITSRIPPTTRTLSHFGRDILRGVGAGGNAICGASPLVVLMLVVRNPRRGQPDAWGG